jgi:hypothetical protein
VRGRPCPLGAGGPLSAAVKERVATELARIADAERRTALEALLIEPRLQLREWDLGEPGARYRTWLIAQDPKSSLGLAYCEYGYGPERPWGYVSAGFLSLGDSAQWYPTLEEAFLASGLAPPAR